MVEHHAGARPGGRSSGRTGRHGRPSALRAAVHARLEEMRFRHGVLLMAMAATAVIAVIAAVTVALTGGSGGHRPSEGAPPVADRSPDTTEPSGASDDPTPEPRARGRRPRTSSSTVLGSSSPQPAVRPSTSPTPSGWPSRWPTDHPRYPRWHQGSPPPWWHHR